MTLWKTQRISKKILLSKPFCSILWDILSLGCNIHSQYCIGLCSYLGASIRTISTWIIVGADSLLNTYHTIKLILMKRKNTIRSKLKEAEIHLTTIILSEVIEDVKPLTFLIIFILFIMDPRQSNMVKSKAPSSSTSRLKKSLATC